MATISIIRSWDFPDPMRQTPGGRGEWGGHTFVDGAVDGADFVIVLNQPAEHTTVVCDPARVFAIIQAPAVGAVIAPSAGSKVEPVLAAIARIAAKYGPRGADAVEPAIWRRMRAYLELERGAALWGGGDKLRGGVALAQSMVLKPRLQGVVERFWDRGGYVSPDVEAAYRSLL
jgi:hypothetical protein